MHRHTHPQKFAAHTQAAHICTHEQITLLSATTNNSHFNCVVSLANPIKEPQKLKNAYTHIATLHVMDTKHTQEKKTYEHERTFPRHLTGMSTCWGRLHPKSCAVVVKHGCCTLMFEVNVEAFANRSGTMDELPKGSFVPTSRSSCRSPPGPWHQSRNWAKVILSSCSSCRHCTMFASSTGTISILRTSAT